MLTAATLHRQKLFNTPARLALLVDTLLGFAVTYGIVLQAWACFTNHYHFVGTFEEAKVPFSTFLRHLHRELALRLNQMDDVRDRKVMYQYWDTHLTFEKSWLARLNYVHQNAVKHGLVPVANQYRWCSAAWFESNASPAFVSSVYSFKTDRVSVIDDF